MRNDIFPTLSAFSLPLACLLSLLIAVIPPSPTVAGSTEGRTFQDLGYGDLTARTMYGTLNYFFPVPRGRQPQLGSQLEILFSHSPLLVPERSTMTIVVNGQSLASLFLVADNSNRARLFVPLPVANFAATGFFVQIQFHLRLTRDECEETQNPALWATVHGDSILTLKSEISDKGPRLEDLEGLFTPRTSPSTPIMMVLPSEPRPEEIEAAGLAAFQAGSWMASARADPILETARAPSSDRPNIIVGTGSALALSDQWEGLRWDGRSFIASGGVIPPEHGVMALGGSSAPRLLVSGGTPAAVREAAKALLRPERRALLAGNYGIITGIPSVSSLSAPWRTGAASFAQLGVEQQQLVGPGEHVLDWVFQRPAGWSIRDGSALELVMETSPALRGDTSWVTVAVNGLVMGTRRLEAGQGPLRRYRFEIPPDLLNADLAGKPLRHMAIQVRLYLDIPQVGCTQTTPASAWATILPASALMLPNDQYTGLDLGRFPAPLLDANQPGPLSVVLPQKPDDEELAAGLQVLAALGRWTVREMKVSPRLTTADQLTDQDWLQHHLVLIGGPERNSASAAAIAVVPALFEPAALVAYRLTPGERRGRLHLAPSPWGRGRAILTLSKDTTGGLQLAAETLARSELLAQLSGRDATVVDALPPQALTAAEPPTVPPTALAPRVETPVLQRFPAWQVTGTVLLGAFLATIAVVGLTRWRRGKG